ncbi:MAG TPA: DUF2807 domain-containing protein, partial [Puia sp.]|nr:DUF2807 domain-containing protein [Puia sp.]
MKNNFLLAALMLTAAVAMGQAPKIINDPNAQKRPVTGFHGIEVSGGIDLYLSQGTEEAVAVSASDLEMRDHIVTSVQDGVLHIYLDDHDFHWRW